jgi:hypothetical protein
MRQIQLTDRLYKQAQLRAAKAGFRSVDKFVLDVLESTLQASNGVQVTLRKRLTHTKAAKGGPKKREKTLSELNAILAATRTARLAAAEANGIKLTGKPRL